MPTGALWDATPGDPEDGPYIARELTALSRLLAEDQARKNQAAADRAMAALLARIEAAR